MALACGPASLLSHHKPASPVLGNREMQAATPAALVRGQLLERFGDEAPAAVTMLTTTPNDALAHAELVHTYEPPRAVPRASACSTSLSVALAPDQVLDEVAFTRREKNVQGPTPAAKQAAKKAAAEQAKATQRTKEHAAEMVTDKLAAAQRSAPAKAEAAVQV
eukprot:scaffold34462_cov56-Phaeocystis_antarctica.AAC.2